MNPRTRNQARKLSLKMSKLYQLNCPGKTRRPFFIETIFCQKRLLDHVDRRTKQGVGNGNTIRQWKKDYLFINFAQKLDWEESYLESNLFNLTDSVKLIKEF